MQLHLDAQALLRYCNRRREPITGQSLLLNRNENEEALANDVDGSLLDRSLDLEDWD
jgi:hypothetical protein